MNKFNNKLMNLNKKTFQMSFSNLSQKNYMKLMINMKNTYNFYKKA